VANLYAELKAKRGKPWPPKMFLDTLNAALGQGFLHKLSGSKTISSLQVDRDVELTIRSEAPKPPEPPPISSNRRSSAIAVLSISELQEFSDQVHTIMKYLAGSDPQIEVRLTVKAKGNGDMSEVNNVLQKLKPGWKL
jgi:hypothetical protein